MADGYSEEQIRLAQTYHILAIIPIVNILNIIYYILY